MTGLSHLAWVEVDLSALAHNAAVLRSRIPSETRLGILVKANAYGHGIEMASRAAAVGGADQLIAATLDEGIQLRDAGLDLPILVVYPVAPSFVERAVEARLELSVSGLASARQIVGAWATSDTRLRLRLHVEVDTGMGRGGVSVEHLADVIELISNAPRAELVGIWSHLAAGRDVDASSLQEARFERALAAITTNGSAVPLRHIAATEGLFWRSVPAYDMVRVGLAFYGTLDLDALAPPDVVAAAAALRPAMTIKARPVHLEEVASGASVGYGSEWTAQRPSSIATLPIGYADGWTRAYSPGASALVQGRRVPCVGRVSMDAVCVDVTDVENASLADEFVLLGAQGHERITFDELARIRGSIPNEVMASIGPRLPRVYVDDGGVVATSSQGSRLDIRRPTRWSQDRRVAGPRNGACQAR